MDGRPLMMGQIMHYIQDLWLSTHDGHTEQISLFILPYSAHSVVLDMPWLSKHNPHKNWHKRTVT